MRQEKGFADHPAMSFRNDDPPAESGDDFEIDIRAILAKLWRGKWIIAVMVAIAAVVALLLVSQMEPRYRATTKVMFDLNRANVMNAEQLVVRSDINEDTLQNEIEILQSTKLIERVVDKLNLDRNPEFNPALREEETGLLPQLKSMIALPQELKDFLQGIGVLKAPAPPADPETQAARERLTVISNVLEGLSLEPVRGSKVIQIAYTAGDPRTAANIANTIAEQYIVDQLDAKLEATRAATTWLSGRVDELRQRVQDAEAAVESARADLSMESGQSLEITKEQLSALNAALSRARNETTATRSTYDRLKGALDENRDYGAITEFRDSPLIRGYREREAELLSQKVSLSATVSEDHPALARLNAQLEEVRRNIRAEAERIVEAARSDWESAKEQEAATEREVRALETKALEQSQQALQIRQLEREAQASRALYENFLSRLKETSEQDKLQSADARILSPAEPPLLPMSNKKKTTFLMAVLLGGMLGVGIIFLLDKLNNTFRAPTQLEALTGETMLGTVPAVGRRMRRSDVIRHFRDKPKSALAESVRSLRTSILFSNVDNPPRTVMFTSSVPREGKSTTSVLMAMTSRQMGKSAIIVDCDLRLPALARLLGADDGAPGLLSVMQDAATLDEAIYRDPDTGLHVLMTKPSEPRSNVNAADILSSRKFHDLIAELKSRYDLVILDTPPALIVADAKILASHADAVVYVVRWDSTPRDAVLEGLKELRSVRAPVAGVALSLVNEARASRYSYDGYSYYKGQYRDYYVSKS